MAWMLVIIIKEIYQHGDAETYETASVVVSTACSYTEFSSFMSADSCLSRTLLPSSVAHAQPFRASLSGTLTVLFELKF
jgi:hypothetical protein